MTKSPTCGIILRGEERQTVKFLGKGSAKGHPPRAEGAHSKGKVMKIKEYTLEHLAKGKLRREDKCSIMRLTYDCQDMEMAVAEIYRMAGV